MKRSLTLFGALIAGAVIVAGCETREDVDTFDTVPATETADPFPADEPAADEFQMRLVNHMQQVRGMDAQQFRQQLPEHRDLVNEMLEDCREMMRDMGMTPPRQFTQVETALEEDLERIPEMDDAELEAHLPQHLDRVQTVIDMRQDMMDDMM
jgi:hypothetical protein